MSPASTVKAAALPGLVLRAGRRKSTALRVTTAEGLEATAAGLDTPARRWLEHSGFKAAAHAHILLPAADGSVQGVLAGLDPEAPMWTLAALPARLPEGTYELLDVAGDTREAMLLGWALGAYRYARYRKAGRAPARLAVTRAELERLRPLVEATALVRDLVNTPTQDLGPAELAGETRRLARRHGARVRTRIGPKLLAEGFPTIHAVGRAAAAAPRLIELDWGRAGDPQLILVGKGVCFDSGGLDLKSASGMRLMKKDMGGAAHVLALAHLVMSAALPVRLTVLVPAVENAVGGNAMRPGEVITTRAGITVEVDNTDAEGRLILCDALALAVEQKPDLIIDFATLTGAARVALGPDLPVLFTNRDALAEAVALAGMRVADPVWRLPLWQPYRRLLKSAIADCCNSASSRHAGAITAALYLEQFVPERTPWLHFDVYAWNDKARPGRPEGGEAMALRAVFAMLQARYR